MHANQRPALEQQKQIQSRAEETDSYAFFNLLTSTQLLDGVEELLPAHRELRFTGIETGLAAIEQRLAAFRAANATRREARFAAAPNFVC